MSFFKKLFQKNNPISEPRLQFGRYTDFYKARSKYQSWDRATELHHNQNYFDSVLAFLDYLSDETLANVEYNKVNEQKLNFKIYQGSKVIVGFANEDGVFAEAKIAKCDELNVIILRSLLEENYHLKYSNYALDSDNNITIAFFTHFIDASPYKLYYGLKEIATRADRRDDVMIEKFDCLQHINNGKTLPLHDNELNIKVTYLKKNISQTIKQVEEDYVKLKANPGLLAYKILATAFSMDFLLKPEGLVLEYIENIHKIFFYINTLSPDQKNKEMIKEMKKILQIPDHQLVSEFYNTISTFGILTSGNHMRVKELIEQELKHYDWYIENGYAEYAKSIPQYIASNLLYTFALPLPDKLHLQLLIRIWHNDFFVDLGYHSLIEGNKVNLKNLSLYFDEINDRCLADYDYNKLDANEIEGYDLLSFSKSYLMQIHNLNSKKKD